MHMGEVNADHRYFLNGNVLESVTHEYDLGVMMSYHCEWKAQIEMAVGKANRKIAWVLRNTVSRSSITSFRVLRAGMQVSDFKKRKLGSYYESGMLSTEIYQAYRGTGSIVIQRTIVRAWAYYTVRT